VSASRPLGSQARWFQRVGPWLGIGTGPGALAVGGALAMRLSPPAVLGVILAGGLLLAVLATAQGWLGQRRRYSLAVQAEATFGKAGWVLNLMMAMGLLGWLGFYIGLGGAMLAHLLGLPDAAGALLLTGLLAVILICGIDQWNAMAIATAIAALLTAILVFRRTGVVWPAPPWPAPTASDIGVGLTQVVAYAIVFALRASDFTWDLRKGQDVVKVGAALYGTLVIFMGIGALMGWTLGNWNPAEALAQTPGAFLGELLLSLAVIAPALSAMHSAALAVTACFSVPPSFPLMVGIAGLGGMLGAGRFDRWLLPFLDGLGWLLPPALAVILTEGWMGIELSPIWKTGAWGLGALGALVWGAFALPFPMLGGMAIALMVLIAGKALARCFARIYEGGTRDGGPCR